jgi:hypothetical protein
VAPSVTGQGQELPPPPTAEELAAAQQQAAAHADDPGTGACPQCGVARCETWREADAVILRGLDGMAGQNGGDDDARS